MYSNKGINYLNKFDKTLGANFSGKTSHRICYQVAKWSDFKFFHFLFSSPASVSNIYIR